MAEQISYGRRAGLSIEGDYYVVGCTRRETKKSTPEEPKFWQGVELADLPDAEGTLTFADVSVFDQVKAALVKAGKPVPVTVRALLRGNSINLDSVVVREPVKV